MLTQRLVVLLALALPACLPGVKVRQQAEQGMVVIDANAGVLPLPFDILRSPDGTMSFPADPEKDTALTVELLQAMNRLDGFIPSINVTVPVDFAVDPATLSQENVILLDVTDIDGPVIVPSSTYYTLFNLEQVEAPPYVITLVNRAPAKMQSPAPFKSGGKYLLLLKHDLTGRKHDADATLGGHALFHFIKSAESLFDQGVLRTELLGDRNDPMVQGMALNIEGMRLNVDGFFQLNGGYRKDDYPVAIPFTIRSDPETIFLPGSLGNVVPRPNDLLQETPSPTGVTLTAMIDGALLDTTVTPESFRLYRLGDYAHNLIGSIQVSPPAAAGMPTVLTASSAQALRANTSYVAFLTGDIRNFAGRALSPSTYFELVRSPNPITSCDGFGNCTTNSYLLDKSTVNVLVMLGWDPTSADREYWAFAHEMLLSSMNDLDRVRRGYQAIFPTLEVELQIPRERVVLLWTFTTGQ